MRKVIATINMTLDGFCDHTAVGPDEEIHQHYAGLLAQAHLALYARITYQLMEYWRSRIEFIILQRFKWLTVIEGIITNQQ